MHFKAVAASVLAFSSLAAASPISWEVVSSPPAGPPAPGQSQPPNGHPSPPGPGAPQPPPGNGPPSPPGGGPQGPKPPVSSSTTKSASTTVKVSSSTSRAASSTVKASSSTSNAASTTVKVSTTTKAAVTTTAATWNAWTSSASTTSASTSAPKASGLHQAMTEIQHRTWFGTAVTIRDDSTERALIDNTLDFGSITPENAMKWETTEPERGVFTFDDADAIVALAQSNGQQIHCHNLVWHSQLAPFVEAGNYDNATLIQIMTEHIEALAGRYKDVCTRWDVVNEALNEDGTYRESVWYNTIGEAYIPIAFSIAARVTPKSELYYNDYNLEYGQAKTAGAQRIVKLIQSYGVRIDGVGFQAHLASETTATAGPAPGRAAFAATLQSVAALGVDVALTELDIRLTTPATEEKLEAQAEVFSNIAGACVDTPACAGITVWGVSDKYSWIPGVFKTEGAALLWDENFNKKPAYQAVLDTLSE